MVQVPSFDKSKPNPALTRRPPSFSILPSTLCHRSSCEILSLYYVLSRGVWRLNGTPRSDTKKVRRVDPGWRSCLYIPGIASVIMIISEIAAHLHQCNDVCAWWLLIARCEIVRGLASFYCLIWGRDGSQKNCWTY